MARVDRTRQSDDDLYFIWEFIADDSFDAADRWIAVLDEKFQRLAGTPLMGRERPELGFKIRSFTVGEYVIYYRPSHDGIELLRVVHGARDVNADYFD